MKNLFFLKKVLIATGMFVVIILFTFGCNLFNEDFTGGTKLVLKVETDYAKQIETKMTRARLNQILKEYSISNKISIIPESQTINISILKEGDERRVKDILDDDFADWNYSFTKEKVSMNLKAIVEFHMRDQAMFQVMEVLKKRLKMLGLKKSFIKRDNAKPDQLILRIPRKKTDTERIFSIILKVGVLELKPVVKGPYPTREDALKEYKGSIPENLEIMRTNPRQMKKGFFILRAFPVISGKDLAKVRRTKGAYGAPAIGFTLTSSGGKRFEKYTGANIGKKLSIVLNNRIVSVPTIESVIYMNGQITGRFTIQEADDLVLTLRSGALAAPIKILEESVIKAQK